MTRLKRQGSPNSGRSTELPGVQARQFVEFGERRRNFEEGGRFQACCLQRTNFPPVDKINKRQFLRDQLGNIYGSHRQGLFTLALAICGCRQLAEDAVQSAFEKLCRSSANPDGDVVNYVFATVRNSARDAVRSKQLAVRRRETLFADFVASRESEAIPEDNMLTAERHTILKMAIDELDEDSRDVVVMKVYAELTFEAIGQILKQPGKTVATRYRRALLKLEERLRGQL